MNRFVSKQRHTLITGGCGFIGHHLTKLFLSKGDQVTVVDNLSTGALENLNDHANLKIVQGSVLDKPLMSALHEGVDLVFHLASVVGMNQAHDYWRLTFETSLAGTKNILESSDAPIVFFSSSAVYGLQNSGRLSENDEVVESSPIAYDAGKRGYASGKWAAERECLIAAKAGRKVMILRPCNVVGRGQTAKYGMVVPRFIQKAVGNQSLTVYDDGKQSRCFSSVDTLVSCVTKLIETPDAWKPGQNIFNLGTVESTRILDLARFVIEYSKSDSAIQFKPYHDVYPGKKDVRKRLLNNSNLENAIGEISWPDTRSIVRQLVDVERERQLKIAKEF